MRNILILISLLFIACKDDPYQPYRETISKVINAALNDNYIEYKKYVASDPRESDTIFYKSYLKFRNIVNEFKKSDLNNLEFKVAYFAGLKDGIEAKLILVEPSNPANGYSEVEIVFSFSNYLGSSMVALVFVYAITDFSEFGDIPSQESIKNNK